MRVIINVPDLKIFDARWDFLCRANPACTPFQSAGWYRAWIEEIAESEGASPLVAEVRDENGALRAALPMQIKETGGIKILSGLTTPWSDYHEALIRPDDPMALSALSHSLAELLSVGGLKVCIEDVVMGGQLHKLLSEVGLRLSDGSQLGAIDCCDREHIDRLLANRNYRRKKRLLQRLGNLQCVLRTEETEVLQSLPHFLGMHRRQWAGRQGVPASFENRINQEAYWSFVRNMAPTKQVMLVELLHAGKSIAYYFGFTSRNTFYGYRPTYSTDYSRYSPGLVLLHEMLASLCRLGYRVVDLMRGRYPSKLRYINILGSNMSCCFDPETQDTPNGKIKSYFCS